ncbi:MAG: lysophospholipid acyltransferase family protein [Bacteroidia bacterium]|nr:lysophospholipid acyltransferase family protein [Methylotenera sp.]
MLTILLKPLSSLSLPAIHRLGSLLGRIMFLLMPVSKQIITNNLVQSQLFHEKSSLDNAIRQTVIESGKSIVESLALWGKKDAEILAWVKSCKNWHLIDEAMAKNKGIIFLTPHLGCFEITSIFYGAKHPISVLYRPPKMQWLLPFIQAGRARHHITLAPANLHGVRILLQALKRGEAIGILPDQIPASGEGAWAPFFGKPAYTMTLASKLANKTGATIIMAFGERRADGDGFDIQLTSLAHGAIATPTLLNLAIEQQIAKNPTQYLWRYPRYKQRRHAMSKDSTTKVENTSLD